MHESRRLPYLSMTRGDDITASTVETRMNCDESGNALMHCTPSTCTLPMWSTKVVAADVCRMRDGPIRECVGAATAQTQRTRRRYEYDG